MPKLEGKVAVITGGSSGIGLATAKRLVAEGAHVFITGRRKVELDKAKAEIGKNVTAVQGDVQNLGDLDKLFAQVKAEKGVVDIVFANAGFVEHAKIFDLSEAHYDKTMAINVKDVVFTVQKALPLMTRGGSIVVNASVVGVKGTLIILNEIFNSTSLDDQVFLSRRILQKILAVDAIGVCVTFIDALSTLSDRTVSMVSTVDPQDPARRTFKVVRRAADGLAYALSLAESHGVTYRQLLARVKP